MRNLSRSNFKMNVNCRVFHGGGRGRRKWVTNHMPCSVCRSALSPPLPFQHRAMRTELASHSHLPAARPSVCHVIWHFFGIASHARFSAFGFGGGGIVTFSLFAVGALHFAPCPNVSTSIVVTCDVSENEALFVFLCSVIFQ